MKALIGEATQAFCVASYLLFSKSLLCIYHALSFCLSPFLVASICQSSEPCVLIRFLFLYSFSFSMFCYCRYVSVCFVSLSLLRLFLSLPSSPSKLNKNDSLSVGGSWRLRSGERRTRGGIRGAL